MSLRDSRDNATVALRFWDDAVDACDACAEANEREPAPGVIDPTRPPIYGERPAPRPKEDARG